MIKKIFLCCFVLFYLNTAVYSIEFFGKFTEGGIVKGKTSPKNKLFLDKKKLKISKMVILFLVLKKEELKILKLKF